MNFKCGFGNIYASNDDRERQAFWEELGIVINSMEISWCLRGDFNTVRSVEEKIGSGFNYSAMFQFSSFIEEIGCIDLPLTGGKYTWSSNRVEPTYCRLDRFLISPRISLTFANLKQNVLPRSLSDHNAISLAIEKIN